jgi:hypothetical protein
MATPQVSAGNGVNLIDLANLFGGQKTSTTGKADTSLISALAPQVLNPADPAALIASLFQQAQGQMPALAAARSNAVGGRTGRNSGIAVASDKLMQDTVLKAQQQIMQQEQTRQQIAAQLATGLAGATRGSTTQQGTNLGRATGVLGLLSAGSKLADTRLGKKAGDLVGQGFNSLQNSLIGSDPAAPADTFVMQDAGNVDPNTYGLDAMTQDLSSFGTFGDFGGEVASAAPDFGGMADWQNEFDQLIGLADGGLIGRDDVAQRKKMDSYKPKGYADGGMVRSSSGGRASSASQYPEQEILRSQAQNVSPAKASAPSSPPAIMPVVAGMPGQMSSSGTKEPMPQLGVDGESYSPTTLQYALAAINAATGNIPGAALALTPQSFQGAAGFGTGVMNSNPISALLGIARMISGSSNSSGGTPPQTSDEAVSVNTDGALSSVPTNGSLTGDAASVFSSANSAGANTSTPSEPGSPGGGDSGGDSGGYADGGEVEGKGSTISDSVPIRVSKNEYVMPADVVEKLGVAFFDNLRANFHVPAAMQALDTDDSNGDDIG